MFSRRSNELLDAFQRRGRTRISNEQIPSDDVRGLLRALRGNAVAWYAPDQAYSGGELIPFFGEPAMTNVATSKIARLTGAALIPLSFRRVAGARYELRFHAPLAGFPSDDPVADTRRLVRILELAVRAAPEQYVWFHRRFRSRPYEQTDPYGRARASSVAAQTPETPLSAARVQD
jgi:KDO2-lipid IV(A) lauroyltransferase